jgi:hypothetical protein
VVVTEASRLLLKENIAKKMKAVTEPHTLRVVKRGIFKAVREHEHQRGRAMNHGHDHTPEEERRIREAALDETVAGSFPASDPPSSLPNLDDHDAEGLAVEPSTITACRVMSSTPGFRR